MLFKKIKESVETSNAYKILVDAEIELVSMNEEADLSQQPLSRNATLLTIIDDQSFDDWSNFENAIHDYIDQNYILHNIAMSKNTNSLSEYIDFGVIDNNGDEKDVIINLRLSNHRPTQNTRDTRLRKLSKIAPNGNYRLVGITVNGETYSSYEEAFVKVKSIIESAVETI